jgi:hypothetical protein
MSKPPDPPPDPSPETLKRISEILHRHQIPPEQADELLKSSVLEVAWRRHPNSTARDDRLLRSVERRALAWREQLLRQRLAAAAAESNGHEADPKDPK